MCIALKLRIWAANENRCISQITLADLAEVKSPAAWGILVILAIRFYWSIMNNPHIVIFDGVCNFCNGAVHFIIKRDPEAVFAFAPMQTDFAKALMLKYRIDNVGVDTFLLIKNEECFVFSNAALEITKDLTGFWYVFNTFKIIPSCVRDAFYKLFARNRYRLFGRQRVCMVPSDNVRSRFIGIGT